MRIKLFICLLVVVFIATGCSNRDIGIDEAKKVALQDAGMKAEDVTFYQEMSTDISRTGKLVYVIAFFDSQKEFYYEINIQSGRVLIKDNDIEDFDISDYPPELLNPDDSSNVGKKQLLPQ